MAGSVFQTQFTTQLEVAVGRGMSEGAARAFATQAAERSAGKALESL